MLLAKGSPPGVSPHPNIIVLICSLDDFIGPQLANMPFLVRSLEQLDVAF